ncbi:MAG: BlaI/MecI/CopY family transcriptional regulator [Gemmatimonadaceae bacterium]|nr:BlaI/MecI/CopY family transcriptional regulator [Gemmatimonadaceae bacterium]
MPKQLTLTDLQLDIMRVLWTRAEATVAEVAHAIRARKLAHATVATILSRLEKRGAISHRNEGRQFVYSARLKEAEVRRSMMTRVKETLFTGDVPALVSQLLMERDINADDLRQVKALIAAKERELEKQAIGQKRGKRDDS